MKFTNKYRILLGSFCLILLAVAYVTNQTWSFVPIVLLALVGSVFLDARRK